MENNQLLGGSRTKISTEVEEQTNHSEQIDEKVHITYDILVNKFESKQEAC